MEYLVRLKGTGRVTVAAYGIADAEHLVEKEVGRLGEAAAEITEVSRAAGDRRIAGEFTVAYTLRWAVRTHAPSADAARRDAFRQARAALAGTRYYNVEWQGAAAEEVP